MELLKQNIGFPEDGKKSKLGQYLENCDFITVDNLWGAFISNEGNMDAPNPPGCKKPTIDILQYPKRCLAPNGSLSLITGTAAKIIAQDGTPPYQYRWDNQAPTATSFMSFISEGLHTIEVIDSAGVRAYKQFEIKAEPVIELYLTIKHFCSSATDPDDTWGKITFLGDRYASVASLGYTFPTLTASLIRVYDGTDYIVPTTVYTGAMIGINAVDLEVGTYHLRYACGTFIIKICDKCDEDGSLERVKIQPCGGCGCSGDETVSVE